MACHFLFHAARRLYENTLTTARDFYIVAIQIWEYFSFYGMRALLILYLTHQLGFNDSHAINLFSAYASLVYVTPILGGWLADRLLGNRVAVITGALLMTLGHVVLGLESDSTLSLYAALAIIICGYGLFKSILAVCWENFTPLMTTAATGLLAALRRREYWIDSRADRLWSGGAVVWLACRLCAGGRGNVHRPAHLFKRSSPLSADAWC